jgi:mono/diheme cytochrome c family protein
MTIQKFVVLTFTALFAASTPSLAYAQARPQGDAQEGRAFALEACTSCHVVAADQRFKPITTATPRPPDFREIANRLNVTAASLLHDLASMPTIPKDSRMANADLTDEQARDVVAYILSLRGRP